MKKTFAQALREANDSDMSQIICEIIFETSGFCFQPGEIQDKLEEIMSERTVELSVNITITDRIAKEKFDKPARQLSTNEFRQLLFEAISDAPFKLNGIGVKIPFEEHFPDEKSKRTN